MLDELMRKLRSTMDFTNEKNVELFEGYLAEIRNLDEPSCISKLINCLDDNAEYQELMYSVIHTIESFDDETYVQELFKTLPNSWEQSPEWIQVLHWRIFNSENTFEEYLKYLNSLTFSQTETVKKISEFIAKSDAEFSQHTSTILSSLKNQI